MAYELNLRPGESGLAPSEVLASVVEVLGLSTPASSRAEEAEEAQGSPEFEISEGATRGRLRDASDDAGQGVGADLILPYGAVGAEVEVCVKRVLEASAGKGLVVFDPQIGGAVAQGDLHRIMSRYDEDSAYHVHLAGTAEDHRQGIASAEEVNPHQQPRASVQAKVLLGLIALVIIAWVFFRACVISPMVRQMEGELEARIPNTGPPPGWVASHPPKIDPKIDPQGDEGTEAP